MILPTAYLGRLRKKRLSVKTRKRGSHKGTRQSNAFGSSMEFSDFRAYQPGDDVRQIDWNVYGRTQKHYIKRFLDEQELSIAIYLDASSSMRALPNKWDLAKQLAASLSFIVLASEDRLSFIPVASPHSLPIRRKGTIYGKQVFHEISELSVTGVSGPYYKALGQSVLKNQQLGILITDGLEPLEELEVMIKKLRSQKQEIWFLQLLGDEEMHPGLSGDVKLMDSELLTEVNVSITKQVLTRYEEKLANHNQSLKALCQRYGCRYLLISDNRDIQTILFHDFPQKGLMN